MSIPADVPPRRTTWDTTTSPDTHGTVPSIESKRVDENQIKSLTISHRNPPFFPSSLPLLSPLSSPLVIPLVPPRWPGTAPRRMRGSGRGAQCLPPRPGFRSLRYRAPWRWAGVLRSGTTVRTARTTRDGTGLSFICCVACSIRSSHRRSSHRSSHRPSSSFIFLLVLRGVRCCCSPSPPSDCGCVSPFFSPN